MRFDEITFAELLDLEPHGPDTFVGRAVSYPWGSRLFGGQVVAQSLRAAAATTDRPPHSLHAYFIRPGSHAEPIRFEVERLRDGRSFTTRQVVARQSSGAILNASISFHEPEDEAEVTCDGLPVDLPGPDDPQMIDEGWGHLLERRTPPEELGFSGHWIRLDTQLDGHPVIEACGLAFMSDAAPFRTARAPHPALTGGRSDMGKFQGASLDHTIWFHHPAQATDWHWFGMRPHGLFGGRGIATGDVWSTDGQLRATIAQQILLRLAKQ
jgi:acyl-CoA thioesterase-2